MAPPQNFPGSGPDLTVFNVLFAAGIALALLGYLTGSARLRMAGILLLFAATAVLLTFVLLPSVYAMAAISSVAHLAGARAPAGIGGEQE